MRVLKIFLLIIILLILYSCEGEIYSPWEVLTTHQYEGHLYCCYFIDSNNGWAAGDFSASIFRYNNGQWHNFPLPDLPEGYKDYGFYDMCFNSENDGWIVGNGLLENEGIRGVIYNWNGTEWVDATPQPYSDVYSLTCVFFPTPDEGWAGSEGGRIYHYINGQWSKYGYLEMSIHSLWFNSPTDGWAVGYPSTLYRWNGTEWYLFTHVPYFGSFEGIVFTSNNDGWLLEVPSGEGGDGVSCIIRWDPNLGNFDYDKYTTFYTIIHSISFSSPDDGWAVGCNHSYHWDGNTWKEVSVPYIENMNLNDVYAISPDDVWAVGDWGTILHFTGFK